MDTESDEHDAEQEEGQDSSQPSRARRWARRLGKGLGGLLLFLLALIVLIVAALQLPFVRQPVKEQILSRVNEGLAGRVEVDTIEGNLLTGATLKQLRIYDGRGHLALHLPQVDAAYDLSGAAMLRFAVSGEVRGGLAITRIYPDGELNWSMISKPTPDTPSGPSSLDLTLESLALHDVEIVYINQSPELLPGAQAKAIAALLDKKLDEASAEERRALLRARLEALREARKGALGAPSMAWFTKNKLEADATIEGEAIGAKLTTLRGDLGLDVVSETMPLELEALQASIEPAKLEARLKSLRLRRETLLDSLAASAKRSTKRNALGKLESDKLEQLEARVEALQVSKELLATLLPELGFKTGARASLSAKGDLKKMKIEAKLRTLDAPGELSLGGQLLSLGEPDRSKLGYDLELSFDKIEPTAYLDQEIPYVKTGGALTLKGKGIDPKTLKAEAKLQLNKSRILQYQLDRASIVGEAKEGRYELEPSELRSPYLWADLKGFGELDGDFEAELKTMAPRDNEEGAHAPKGTVALKARRADLKLNVSGQLVPERFDSEDPAQALRSLELDTTWNIAGFEAEDIKLERSEATIALRIKEHDREHRDITMPPSHLEVDALKSPWGSVARLRMNTEAGLRLRLPPEGGAFTIVQRPTLTLDAQTTGLRSPQLSLSSGDIELEVKPQSLQQDASATGGARQLALGIRNQLSLVGLRTQGIQLRSIRGSATGQVRLDDRAGLEPQLVAFNAQGGYVLEDFRQGASVRVARLELDLEDLAGDQRQLSRGQIKAKIQGLQADKAKYARLELDAQLGDGRQITANVSAERAAKATLGPKTVKAFLDSSYAPGFTSFSIARFVLEVNKARWSLLRPTRVGLDNGLSFDALSLARDSSIKGHRPRLSIDGRLNLSGRSDVRANIKSFELSVLEEDFGLGELLPQKLKGAVTMQASLEGRSARPRIGLELQLADVHVGKEGPINARLDGKYADDRLELEDLMISAMGLEALPGNQTIKSAMASIPMRLDLDGNVRLLWDERVQLRLTIPPIELARIAELVPTLGKLKPRGTVGGELSASGTLGAPTVMLNFLADNIGAEGNEEMGVLPFEGIEASAQVQFTGRRGSEVRITSHLAQKGEKLLRLSVRGRPLPLVDWIRKLARGEELQLRPELRRTTYSFTVDMPELDVRRIPLAMIKENQASGRISALIKAVGKIDEPVGRFDLHVKDAGWQQYQDIYLDVETALDRDVLKVNQLAMEWDGDNIFRAEGQLPMPIQAFLGESELENMPLSFAFQINPKTLPLRKLSALDYQFQHFSGAVGGFMKLRGSLRKPEFAGRMALFDTELGRKRRGTVAFSVEAANNVVRSRVDICIDREEVMVADVRLPMTLDVIALADGAPILRRKGPNNKLAIALKGKDIELGELVPANLINRLAGRNEDVIKDVGGKLSLDVDVEGTWDAVTPRGQIKLEKGRATLVSVARRFEDMDIEVNLNDERIELAKLNFKEHRGEVKLHGWISHTNLQAKEMQLFAETREFNVGSDFPIYLSTKVDVKGSRRTVRQPWEILTKIPDLKVDVPSLGEKNTYATSLNEEILIDGSEREETIELKLADQPLYGDEIALLPGGRMRANIAVLIPNASRVNLPFGHVMIIADDNDKLRANINGSSLRLNGRVRTTSGEVEFLDKQFSLTRGIIAFTNGESIDPRLQIQAQHFLDRALAEEIGQPAVGGQPRVIVEVTGNASDPRLKLKSDPAMSKTDIVYVLVTGRPPDAAEVGQSAGVANRALGAASSFVANQLRKQLPSAFSPDLLKIETGEGGFSESRLEVGKYLTDELFVTYKRQFGVTDQNQSTNIIGVEYHFAPRWMIAGQAGDASTFQVNLFWDVW